MLSTRGPSCLAVVLLLLTLFGSSTGSWRYNRKASLVSISDRRIAYSAPSITVQYLRGGGQLSRFMTAVKNPDYLAQICESESTVNKYGFNKWKNEIFLSVTGSSLTEFRINWEKIEGFALKENEVINCGPLVNLNDASQTYYDPPTDTPDPTRFSFVFSVESNVAPTLEMRGTNQDAKAPKQMFEGDIRKNGFIVELKYINDCWNRDDMDAIFNAFTCNTNCLDGILRKEHINITDAEPNVLRIHLDSVAVSKFNIAQNSIITFLPTTTTSYKGIMPINKLENYAYTVYKYDPPPVVVIRAPTPTGFRLLPDTEPMVLEERCLRGKDASCQNNDRSVFVSLIGGTAEFNPPAGGPEIFALSMSAINSSFTDTFMAFRDTWVYQIVKNGPNAITIQLKTLDTLEIWQDELVEYAIAGAFFSNTEPPSNGPFRMKLMPSPGTILWTPGTVTESILWDGGYVMNITIDGESWNEDEVRRSLIADSGADANGVINVDGWNNRKEDVVPAANITFPSPDTITITFVQNLLFDIGEPETVTLRLTKEMTRSGLAPDTTTVEFKIEESLGRGVMNGIGEIHERDVWNGDIQFKLTLTGESWVPVGPRFDQCRVDLLAQLESNQTTQKGFTVQANRDLFLSSPIVFEQLDAKLLDSRMQFNRTVQFTAVAVPRSMYDVETGEIIKFKDGKVPTSCLNSGSANRPETDFEIDVIPQNALIEVSWRLNHNGAEVDIETDYRAPFDPNATDASNKTIEVRGISETRLRKGGLSLHIVADLDFFNGISAQDVFDNLDSDGVEPTGWDEKKHRLTKAANVDVSNRSQIIVSFPDLYAPFDVSVNELVTLDVKPEWMLSRRVPNVNPRFAIYVAPGIAELVTWSGESANVTEDDIRRGLVNFTFALLGDSWRQQRQPFIESLIPLSITRYGMSTYNGSIVPGVDFFSFTYKDGIETMIWQLQAVPEYDISQDEDVEIKFANRSVASLLSPTVSKANGEEGFVFTIHATRGSMVLSGVVEQVQEKLVRQGRVTVFITLFGETFDTATAPQLIFDSLTGVDSSATGFNALKTSLLSPASINASETHARLDFTGNKLFNIETTEQLRFNFPPTLFASRVVPSSKHPTVIDVTPSGGELTFEIGGLPSNELFTEEFMRHNGLALRLKLFGDTWNEYAISRQPYTFLNGFSASAPVLTEPHGFNANFYYWAPNITFLDASTIELYLCGNCSGVNYNIAEDEFVSYAVANTIFVNSGLPEPSSISMNVTMIPREMLLIFDTKRGQVTVDSFSKELSTLISVPKKRIQVTSFNDIDTIQMHFSSPLTSADSGATLDEINDIRSSTELSDLLLGLNGSFSAEKLFVSQKYYVDSAPSDDGATTTTQAPSIGGGSSEALMDGQYGTMIWIAGVGTFLGIIGLFMYCSSLMRRSKLPGKLRPSSDPSTHQRKVGHAVDGVQYDRGDENYGISDGIDPLKVYAGQRKHTLHHSTEEVQNNPLGLVDKDITTLKQHVRLNMEVTEVAEDNQRQLGLPTRRILLPRRTVYAVDSDDD